MKRGGATARMLAEIAGVDVSTVFVTARMLREILGDVPEGIDHVDHAQEGRSAVGRKVLVEAVAR